MEINPYIGNKTHFINSLLGGALGPRAGFVFTVLGSFKTDNILDTDKSEPCHYLSRK